MNWKMLGLAILIVCAFVALCAMIVLLPTYLSFALAFAIVVAVVYLELDTESKKEE